MVTINLRHEVDFADDRLPLIADEIVRLDPHLIGLQEIYVEGEQGRALVNLIGERLGTEEPYYRFELPKAGFYQVNGEGTGIFSKWPFEERDLAKLEYGRRVLWASTVSPDGQRFEIFNTHLHNEEEVEDLRLTQAEIVVDFMDTSGDGLKLLTGDMNDTDQSDAITHLTDNGLIDTFRAVNGEDTATLGNTSPIVLEPGAFEQNPTRRIDYIFSREHPEYELTSSEVVFRNHNDEGLYPSDHLGVISRFTRRGSAP